MRDPTFRLPPRKREAVISPDLIERVLDKLGLDSLITAMFPPRV